MTDDVVGYGPEYEAAWAAMIEKPWAWGLAPIHHGCFENGWRGALIAAADIAHAAGADGAAVEILALAHYDETAKAST
jgi:hypothetical protein